MAYYRPCKNCAVDNSTCPRRAALVGAISGQHVTSINFVCRDRQSMFRTGQRVSLRWVHWELNDYGDSDSLDLVFHGTVLIEKGTKFIVRVDDGPAVGGEVLKEAKDVFNSDRLVIKIRPADMSALDEQDRSICTECTSYLGESGRCNGYGKPGAWDAYWPRGCIMPPMTPTPQDGQPVNRASALKGDV